MTLHPHPVQVPEPGSEYAAEGKALLSQLVGGGCGLLALVSSREKAGPKDKHPKWSGGNIHVNLLEPSSQLDVTVEMLQGEAGGGSCMRSVS